MVKRFRFIIFLILIRGMLVMDCYSQTRSELEMQRQKALEEIEYIDDNLKSTAIQREEGINDLRVLERKVVVRKGVIEGLNEEISLLSSRIDINSIAIEMMEEDLLILKEEYKNAVVQSYKTVKINPDIVYILSARDFNQGYKRIKYLQQLSEYRRKEAEMIIELKYEIERLTEVLMNDLDEVSKLKENEVNQAVLLESEQSRQERIINDLRKKETQLRNELIEKQNLAKKIEDEIERLIAEEKERSRGGALTPEQILIGENFAQNKGRLPWPVDRGVITSKFGRHQHPVFQYLMEDNIGVEITSNGKTSARCVFKGEVSAITAIPGSNMTVIIRHGSYLSVYNNIVNVTVKKGDIIETKQEIGEVFQDPDSNNMAILNFMIFESEYLDPEIWIAGN